MRRSLQRTEPVDVLHSPIVRSTQSQNEIRPRQKKMAQPLTLPSNPIRNQNTSRYATPLSTVSIESKPAKVAHPPFSKTAEKKTISQKVAAPSASASAAPSASASAAPSASARAFPASVVPSESNIYKLKKSNISRENYSDVMSYIYNILDLFERDRIPATAVLQNIIDILLYNIKKNIQNLKYFNELLSNIKKYSKKLGKTDKERLERKVDKIIKNLEKDVPILIILTNKFQQHIENQTNNKKVEMDEILTEIAQTFFKV